MKQSFVDFFDPYNTAHIKAYQYLSEHGKWPIDFAVEVSHKCYMDQAWQIAIMDKIAMAELALGNQRSK